ncbi:hypothetical protein P8452_54122 [Trifolium repens]|nr:hypothetical protein P8452_54122 [Trifolium repens]
MRSLSLSLSARVTHTHSLEKASTSDHHHSASHHRSPPFPLSARPHHISISLLGRVFKALSPEKPVAATGHHIHKSFLYLLLPFVSHSIFYMQQTGKTLPVDLETTRGWIKSCHS